MYWQKAMALNPPCGTRLSRVARTALRSPTVGSDAVNSPSAPRALGGLSWHLGCSILVDRTSLDAGTGGELCCLPLSGGVQIPGQLEWWSRNSPVFTRSTPAVPEKAWFVAWWEVTPRLTDSCDVLIKPRGVRYLWITGLRSQLMVCGFIRWC